MNNLLRLKQLISYNMPIPEDLMQQVVNDKKLFFEYIDFMLKANKVIPPSMINNIPLLADDLKTYIDLFIKYNKPIPQQLLKVISNSPSYSSYLANKKPQVKENTFFKLYNHINKE